MYSKHMEHGSHLVDIIDQNGQPVAQKPRKEIDKTKDLYHSVHTLLISPLGELVLTQIPERKDLPNIYANQLGATVATIKRSDETPDEAAQRSVARELFIDNADLQQLGSGLYTLSDGKSFYMTAYYLIGSAPETYSHTDSAGFTAIAPARLRKLINEDPHLFAPTFMGFWQSYHDQLPV